MVTIVNMQQYDWKDAINVNYGYQLDWQLWFFLPQQKDRQHEKYIFDTWKVKELKGFLDKMLR